MGSPRLLVAAIGVLLLGAVGWPLLQLFLAWDPASLVILGDPVERAAIWNTLRLALGTTLFATALGVPLGFALARGPALHGWRAVATLPYVIPPYVTAIAWIALLNPSNGWLNEPIRALGLPPLDIYGVPGMVWVMGLEHAPIVWLATADALGRADASLEEQARLCGASPWGVLRRITLPLAFPSIGNAAALVLASSSAAFGVPYLLASGAASPDFVLTTRIAAALQLGPALGFPRAISLAACLILLGIGLPALILATGRRRTVTVGGRGARAAAPAGRWAPAVLAAYIAVALVVPLGTVLVMSVWSWDGRVSLDAYAAVLGRAEVRAAIGRSLALATATAAAGTAIGVAVAWVAVRGRHGWLATAVRVPYAVPGTVLALGILLAWSQPLRIPLGPDARLVIALADTVWLLLLAYTVKLAALPLGVSDGALRALDPALEEAARVAGASAWRTFAQVTLPLLRPALITGAWLAFVPAFTEVTMSVLLAGPSTRVVGVVLFDLQSYGDPPGAAALAVVVAGVAVLGQLATQRWQREVRGA